MAFGKSSGASSAKDDAYLLPVAVLASQRCVLGILRDPGGRCCLPSGVNGRTELDSWRRSRKPEWMLSILLGTDSHPGTGDTARMGLWPH